MLSQLKGDPIVTIGGLHGVIDSIDQQAGTVVIDSDGIYLTFNLNAVRGVASRPATQPRLQQQKPKPPTQMNSVWLRKHLILRPSPMINRLLLTAMPKQTMTSRLKVKA
ncbi:preprotein translocase subunit YajC [Lacticaseibacillus rhamnosus MTCC 5462]|nr:preprotein translocase subunit YajC [Lacticaseibacillus rhamnosus MTCC 5462]